MPVAEAEEVEHLVVAVEMGVDVHLRARREHHEDEPGSLGHRERREAQGVDIDRAEELSIGHADEVAKAVVDPVVVGAGEAPRSADAVLHDHCAAVAARVDEGPDLTIGAAHDQHRHVHHGHRLVGMRTAQLTPEGQHERESLEERNLSLPAGRIQVVLDRYAHHIVDLARCVAGLDVADVHLGHLDELATVLRRLSTGERTAHGTQWSDR